MTTTEQASLYSIVKRKIMKKIQIGQYKVADKFPTEMELCKINVSRTTVKIARCKNFLLEGRINKIQGKGTICVEALKFGDDLSTIEETV